MRPVHRLLVRLHRWLGLATGAVVLVVGLTGAVYVWEAELFDLQHPELVRVTPAASRRPIEELRVVGQAALPAGHSISRVLVPADPGRAVVLTTQRLTGGAPHYFAEFTWYEEVFVDPYTARVLGVVDRKYEWLFLTRMIHTNLLLADRGTWIVGTATLVFIALSAIGLALWWPRTRKVLAGRLRPRLAGSWKRAVFDGHNVLGFYAFLGLFVVAVTGPVWTWRWYTNAIAWALTGQARLVAQPVPIPVPMPASSIVAATVGPREAALRATRLAVPSAHRYTIEIPPDESRVLTVGAVYRGPSAWEEYERYYYHPVSAELLGDERFEEKNRAMKWRNSNYGIHTGTLFGWPTQVVACLLSLFTASLPVTGFLIWLPRWRRRTGRPARPAVP